MTDDVERKVQLRMELDKAKAALLEAADLADKMWDEGSPQAPTDEEHDEFCNRPRQLLLSGIESDANRMSEDVNTMLDELDSLDEQT